MLSYPLHLMLLGVLLAGPATGAQAQNAEALEKQAMEAYHTGAFVRSAALFTAALEAGAERGGSVAYNAACAHALTKNGTEEAFGYLDLALQRGWLNAPHLQRDPDLEVLHNDPRWADLVHRMERQIAYERRRWAGEAFETPYREDLPTAEKVAGLSRLWAEVKFNFVNFDLVPELDWDALYLTYLPRVTATSTTLDYYRLMMEMTARLRDGHSNVYPPDELFDQVYARPGLRTRRFGEAVAVIAVYDSTLMAEGITPGLELVAIAGQPVEAYAEAHIRPYQSSSTAQDLASRTYEYALLSGPPGPLPLTFRRADGTTFTHTVQRLGREAREAAVAAGKWASARRPPFRVTMLPGDVAHIELNSFGSNDAAEQFAAQFDTLAQASALIFDVRNNGGGSSNVGWAILAHLTDQPFPVSNWHTLAYHPTSRARGRQIRTIGEQGNTYGADATRHYTGPVAVLISPRTFSAAEDFAVAFDAMNRGLLVGEPTGGSTGQPLFFRLPGGGRARVTTKHDTYPDGRAFIGVGVQPDRPVQPTLEDLRSGRDAVLEAAIKALHSTSDP